MFFSYFILTCISVDPSKYLDCRRTPFCNRNRFLTNNIWVAHSDLVETKEDAFSIVISNTNQEIKLIMHISFLLQGSIHVKFSNYSEEVGPKRFDSSKENTIVNQTICNNYNKYSFVKNQSHVVLNSQSSNINKICIQLDPFVLYIYENDKIKLSFNEDESMVFESQIKEQQDNDDDDSHQTVAGTFIFYDNQIRFSGLPSHTLSMNLPDTTHREMIRFYNTDINRFEVDSGMAMYGSIPYIVGHSGMSSSSIFWCNPSETYVDIGLEKTKKVRFISETNFVDFFVFFGNHSSVIEQFSSLTGLISMQQMFLFGYHQCRWTYYSSKEIRSVSKRLDKNHIPHDVMWLDLDHTDDKRYFTFNHNYTDILQLTSEMVANKRRLVAQVDPHLQANTKYRVYKEALDRKFLILEPHSKEIFYGNCWPGRSAWVDFFNPNARLWWSNQFKYSFYVGSSKSLFVWNDMNEPAVFDRKDFSLPKASLHFRDYQDRTIHNLYGHFMVMSTYNGVLKRNDDQNERPFVLTRSYFAGSQKYALMWTGDNTANWAQLKASLIMSLSLSISAFPLSGSDVGGFFDSPDQDLLSRWYQLGAFSYTFFRCHCHHLSDYREPYTLKGEYFDRAKNAITERYTLLPLWYSVMYESHISGHPIIRPIWYEFGSNCDDIDDQVMIGDTLMATPIVTKEQSLAKERPIILPSGSRWFDFRTLLQISNGKKTQKLIVKDETSVPCFIRGGKCLIKKDTLRQSSEAMFNDPFTLIVALDSNQQSEGKLYIDDGHSFNYSKGDYIYCIFKYEKGVLSNTNLNKPIKNTFLEDYKVEVQLIKVIGLNAHPKKIINQSTGKEISFTFSDDILSISNAGLYIKDDWRLVFSF